MRSRLITISAFGGGGKTDVSKALAKSLNINLVFHFDELEEKIIFPTTYPHANANEYNLDLLIELIKEVKDSSSSLIIFDYPFGKCHTKMNNLIDYAVFIDVPLDITMSRRLLRDLRVNQVEHLPRLIRELKNYEHNGRKAYLSMLENVKPSCDLVVDGTKSIEILVKEISQKIV